ncbi:30S ribosomal protein S1 [Silvibacterium acidisoli]|uniref:30S ribosomal protein S1 n=1 Tax=Acidobacteriaceae bacterium ZG23-2 TaxID=2883246 RepID=UPI00406CD520
MTNPEQDNLPSETAVPSAEQDQSFADILSAFEKQRTKSDEGERRVSGTVIAVTPEFVFVDVGSKTEGALPLSAIEGGAEAVKPGDKLSVTVRGRNAEGYYDLSLFKIAQPKDWTSLERSFADKSTIVGTVTAVVKGGFRVDVGVTAFMPASRSGVRDAAEMEKLVGQEIRCRITKLDATEEDVVIDRRAVLEEEQTLAREKRYSEVSEGDVIRGTVRSLAEYGAFIDLGGVDGLLHISDISWSRVNKPEDVLSVGQELEVKVLKISPEGKKLSLGLKQLQAHPWDAVPEKYNLGERVSGTVTRLADFGAFVELEPGVEGLIHVSEMSWVKKVKKPSDLLNTGDTVEAVILGINPAERRLSLGLKQALGDPWADIAQKFPAGSVVEGPVSSFTKFGAFVQLAEGVEGMVHISEITAEKRLNTPQDALRAGEVVKAQVLSVDKEKRQIKLSIKQLVPQEIDEYIAEHKAGDTVTGRIVSVEGQSAKVELGDGIIARATIPAAAKQDEPAAAADSGKVDLSALSSMLKAKWKSGPSESTQKAAEVQTGQLRSFRIVSLNAEAKQVELEMLRG